MRPGRQEIKAGNEPIEMPEGGVEPSDPCLLGAGGNLPADPVGDEALAKLDALEKRLDELQETLDELLPDLGSAEGED